MPGLEKDSQISPIPGPRGGPGYTKCHECNNAKLNKDPIAKVTFAGETSIVINSVALTSELCDETRFHKHISSGLDRLRPGTNDGLFTAHDHEDNWKLAHRLLVPAFGPLRIRAMFPQMYDIARQLCMKWLRYGPKKPLNLSDDFTRATLDTIALCAMGYRFNSFYMEGDFHPFVNSMVGFLKEAEMQSTLPSILNYLRPCAKKGFKSNIEIMRKVCAELIETRRQSDASAPQNDLLDTMMHAKDNISGESLSDDSIIDNILIFLIAGHETTSGLLSFVLHYLLKNPEEMQRTTREIDDIIGDQELTIEHLSKLNYTTAVLRETLRLMPTAPGFTVTPYKKEIIGGKYQVNPGDSLDIFLPAVHRDPHVYGPDPDVFRPERMLDESFQKLPANSWKPFGNGKRGCIGRAFAWQEALMILALCLQNFSMALVDKSYELKLKESLTIKPDNLWAYATPRPGRGMFQSSSLTSPVPAPFKSASRKASTSVASVSVTILYGSNSGTCEALAHRLSMLLDSKRSLVSQVKQMDAAIESEFPESEPVIIITGSYDGKAPSNAVKFVDWLTRPDELKLQGTKYAVFGCGHRDWVNTFHKVPSLADTLLEQHGGHRIAKRGAVDTAEEDPFAELEIWTENELWPALVQTCNIPHDMVAPTTKEDDIQVNIRPPYSLRAEYDTGIIQQLRTLTAPEIPEKLHVEVALPSHMKYEPGDHLAILPFNSRQSVQRVLSHFKIGEDSIVYMTSCCATSFPTDTPISAADLLGGYVELGQLATPLVGPLPPTPALFEHIQSVHDAYLHLLSEKSLKAIAAKTTDADTAKRLTHLAEDQYTTEVREKHLSIIDILEQYSITSLTFEEYLQMLPPLRARSYTISSSPRYFNNANANANLASLTVSVVHEQKQKQTARETASLSPLPRHHYHTGVASTHLLTSIPGSTLRISLRHAGPDFRLPPASQSPIIMIAAGSGLAPFRAFIQERAIKKQNDGIDLPSAVLFFGCKSPLLDDIYRDELDGFEAHDVVTVFRAFSRVQGGHIQGDSPRRYCCGYVQNLLLKEKAMVKALWDQGAKVFVCGGGRMNDGVRRAMTAVVDCELEELAAPRYVAEVFL
ncbi:hypothetical protein AbraIFM66951_006685 [Aspergillus brasiliensis]|uniref:Bifunctional cytochrome P450/NADPH--P450 reductase n=1 Tax=Aspergillus brasiliensis TaxID=319629 RepID=A0A9W6DNR5_9EURO|nr:hypothetical protein AbraCBS73388_007398 [Aspergillus brasiliensis]GKZ44481.1 hypothetical protein AbraIFM66951_006685 [Aspergillus brasiliensis]